MTFTQILEQAQALSLYERRELAKLLIDSLTMSEPATQPKTGAEIVATLEAMDPIEFVDEQIEDPVEWVKAQRRKEAERLNPYGTGDHD